MSKIRRLVFYEPDAPHKDIVDVPFFPEGFDESDQNRNIDRLVNAIIMLLIGSGVVPKTHHHRWLWRYDDYE